MHVPPAFREDRPDVLRALMVAHPLATLVTVGGDGLRANLVPFRLEETAEGEVLQAHLARGNDQLPALAAGAEALVIFQGPQAYISPSWYETKKAHGRVVPTWNYVVVQAWGTARVVEDANWMLEQVTRLTNAHEAGRDPPWGVGDAPADYIAAQLRAIVGLEIPIRRLEGKWKVSQNHPEANRRGVSQGLRAAGETAMAEAVDRAADASDPSAKARVRT